MLPSGDKMLFKTYIPTYGEFNAVSVLVKSIANDQSQSNNVHDLQNHHVYDLAKHDIVYPHDAVLISTQERYRSYVNWFIKNKPGEDLNLRLSKKKLPTKSLRGQLVMLLRRFHPWKEELDYFILRITESGVLEAWGNKPLLVDVGMNPNILKLESLRKLDLEMFQSFFIFLALGLAISALFWLVEYAFSMMRPNCAKCFKKPMPMLAGFGIWTLLCFIAMSLFTWQFFREDEKFPAVVGENYRWASGISH